MSRHIPFPLAHRLVQHPISPPDTEVTAIESSSQAEGLYDPKSRVMDSPGEFVPSHSHRRNPSIFYKANDGLREQPAPRKLHRWLVVVIPPPVLIHDYANSSDRPLSHAVMMPLFPSVSLVLCSTSVVRNLIDPCISDVFPACRNREGIRPAKHYWHQGLLAPA